MFGSIMAIGVDGNQTVHRYSMNSGSTGHAFFLKIPHAQLQGFYGFDRLLELRKVWALGPEAGGLNECSA